MEAEKKIPLVKSKGFKDAYIVAFNDGKIIPVKNAVKLESKEIPTTKVKTYQNKEEIEEVELDIIFVVKGHVNVGDSLIVSKLKLDLPEEKELYLDEKENLTQVIIKSFSNYDEAEDIKRILNEKGVEKVEIHAYFAENQIPLKQARKITK